MASREIKYLSPAAQVLWQKFSDKVRRDTELLRDGYSLILTCTFRTQVEQEKLYERGDSLSRKAKISDVRGDGCASNGFEFLVLQYGRYVAAPQRIIDHAEALGLRYVEPYYFEVR